ncbi:MAG: hypothetical protein K2K73_02610, partial [Ureaplasma sp.]|nr:hypothetical protein [Ureaplasma sp.]
IDFQKLTENNTYSITLMPNKDFIFDWVNNQNNTTDFIIQRKLLTINFNKVIKIENNDLIQLREDVNIYLQQRNINYLTWLEHFDAKDQEYQDLMNFIYQKLDASLSGTFPNDCIDSLELLDNGNDVYSLKIIPNSGYKFLSNSNYYENGNIILIDVDIYSYIEFNGVDLDSFFSQLQSTIDTERYSKEQFNQWINTPEFKDYVGVNLKIANGNKIEIKKIESISYDIDSNELKITPTNAYRFKLLDTSTNVIVNSDGELIISSLQLFEYIHFEQLSKLFDGFQVFIDDAKFSNDEFKEYVKDLRNLDTLKSMISNYLYTSSNHKIDSNKITNIDFVSGNLLIYFDDSYSVYSSESYENANLSINILTIKNLRF